MVDITENIRETLTNAINAVPMEKEALETAYGKSNVWDTKELQETFEVIGFAAPFCMVIKKRYKGRRRCYVPTQAKILF